MGHSVLSGNQNVARSFYLKLGFICHDEYGDDNGLSQTSKGFQKAVKKFPQLWVSPRIETMSLFQLFWGRLNLPPNEDNLPQSNPTSKGDWRTYTYAKFPWRAPSMKKIEGYLDTRPILGWLSGEALPLTDQPLKTTRSVSNMSGMIVGSARQKFSCSSWLSTDDIQFLFALLLRNQESHRCFHRPHCCFLLSDMMHKC